MHAAQLMAHHVYLCGPAVFKAARDDIDTWKQDAHKSVYKKSLLIVAMVGVRPEQHSMNCKLNVRAHHREHMPVCALDR